MRSTYFKNFTATAGMVLISFFILGTVFVFLGRNFMVSERRAGIYANAGEVVRTAAAFSLSGELDGWELRMSLSTIARTTGNLIFITDFDGCVISCSDMEIACPHMGKYLGDGVMAVLHDRHGIEALTDLEGFFSGIHYVAVMPVLQSADNTPAGYVFVSSENARISMAWREFMNLFLVVAVSVLLIALILSYFTSRHTAKPLNETAAAAVRFGRGDYSVRVKTDTRNKEIFELTEAFNAMAQSLEKSEELRNEFIENVSHELKTPMTTISGFANGILDGTIPPENREKYLAVIAEETTRLSRLVRRMLDMTKIRSGDVKELKKTGFDISELLRRTLLTFESKITAKKLTVDARLPEEEIIVSGDADSITQVIFNILDNAIKFSEENSELGLSLRKQGPKAYVSVKNHGETIPENELPLIFDRFHKTDRSRSKDRDGVGLGLYIVKAILDKHEEDIFVTAGHGTTEFIFTLTLRPAVKQ
ncbi:MAG: HAMP domain-containing histidine kinase [Oscillospiraceae bacterium]|nr:HAMP domain-containing histidine kinase [Oscillospiraceae bacterium]